MRPIKVTVNAAGNSQWIPVDYLQRSFGIGLGVVPWSTATGLTYTVQHVFDDIGKLALGSDFITIARAGTTATVTDVGPDGLGHGMSSGDNVVIYGSGSKQLDTPKTSVGGVEAGDLGADITVVSNTTYTYAVANAGPTTDSGSAKVVRLRVFPHATLNTGAAPGSTGARGDGNYAFEVRAIRLKANTLTGGAVDLLVLQSSGR